MEKVNEAVALALSRTLAVNMAVPATVGAPLIAPVAPSK
jgi:hypothetical protein